MKNTYFTYQSIIYLSELAVIPSLKPNFISNNEYRLPPNNYKNINIYTANSVIYNPNINLNIGLRLLPDQPRLVCEPPETTPTPTTTTPTPTPMPETYDYLLEDCSGFTYGIQQSYTELQPSGIYRLELTLDPENQVYESCFIVTLVQGPAGDIPANSISVLSGPHNSCNDC